jgi:hypothetical protein
MVTGDSKETALAIAQRCGILGNLEEPGLEDLLLTPNMDGSSGSTVDDLESGASVSLSGADLDAIPPQNLADSIIGVRVFYRVVPRHKLAIVRALQAHGDIVAMTGDGVNDATALMADIGCHGEERNDVAKEAADVILADDDFQPSQWRLQKEGNIFQYSLLSSLSAEHFVCRTHNGKRRDRLWNAVTFKRDANPLHQYHYGWVSLSHALYVCVRLRWSAICAW